MRTIFVTLTPWSFNTAWFDEVDGVLAWKYPLSPQASPDTYLIGLDTFLHHLAMLYRPFVLQLAVYKTSDYDFFHSNNEKMKTICEQDICGSWTQLFPLSKSECESRVLAPCLEALDVEH